MIAPNPAPYRTPWAQRLRAEPSARLDSIALASRIVFAATLCRYFWASGLTKLEGWGLSLNAYAQILPKQMEAAGYDVSALGIFAHATVALGTMAEFVLPALICAGLFTRLASAAMAGFIVVMSLTDVFGHGVGVETAGLPFDRFPDGVIADQRLLWLWLLATLVLTGGGYLSLDRWKAATRSEPVKPRNGRTRAHR